MNKVCRYLFGSSSNRCLGNECTQFVDGMCADVMIAISLKKIAEKDGSVVVSPDKVISNKKLLVEDDRDKKNKVDDKKTEEKK